MKSGISDLTSMLFKKIYQRVHESYLKTILLLVFVYVIGFPLLRFLQNFFENINYFMLITFVIKLIQKNFNITGYIVAFLFLVIFFLIFYIYSQLRKLTRFSEDFSSDLSRQWINTSYSNWKVQKCEDVPGKMLRLTMSRYPGILKAISEWFDYEITFKAKIDQTINGPDQKIGIIIRSINTLNGILFEITKSAFSPSLLYNGICIKDTEQAQELPTILEENQWYKFKICVKGNNIDIFFENYKLTYKIPTKNFNNSDYLLKNEVSLKELEDDSNKQMKLMQNAVNSYLEATKYPVDSLEYNRLMGEFKKIESTIPKSSRVIIEYQKGSVGFWQRTNGIVYLRNILIYKVT